MHIAMTATAAVALLALFLLRNPGVLERLRADQRGEVTEKVIITALFAALALTAATIITIKVTDKAKSIPTEPPAQQGSGLGE
jgi:cytochrome P450